MRFLTPSIYQCFFQHRRKGNYSTESKAHLLAVGVMFGLLSAKIFAQSLPLAGAPPDLIEAGVPAFVVLSPEALGLTTAPVDLKQLPDGRLLAVGHNELALGDGVRWESFRQVEGDTQVDTASVAVDQDGVIYAGVPGGFARINFEQDSRWRFVRLENLPAGVTPASSAPIHTAVAGNEWLWWWGSGSIFSWKPGSPAKVVGRASAPERVFQLNGITHLSDYSNGELFKMEAGTLKLTNPPIGKVPVNQTITSLALLDDNRVLFGTAGIGVLISEGGSVRPLVEKGMLTSGHRINDLCATDGGFFAAAVDNVGIVFFDRTGRTVQILDKSIDHRLARARRLLRTPGGVIWALLNEGIVRVNFPSRVSQFEPLVSTGLAFARPHRLDGRLWLLSDGLAQRGIYDESGRLERFQNDSPPGFLSSLSNINGSLFASGTNDIFVRDSQNTWNLVASGPLSSYICPEPCGPDRWLYVAENEIGWLKWAAEKFSIERIPIPELGHPHGGLMDAHGIFWAELGSARIARVDTKKPRPTVEVYGLAEGVPDGWVQVFKIDDEVRISVPGIIKIFNRELNRFVPDTQILQQIPVLEGAVGRPTHDASGRLWMTNHGRVHIYAFKDGRIEEAEEHIPDGILPMHFNPQSDGVVWMHQRLRLARYDPAMPAAQSVPLRTLITRVRFPASNREFFSVGTDLPPFSASDNAFVVHFVAPNNSIAQPVTFEIKLDGAVGDWSSTGATGSAAFNHLEPGKYELRVRARSGDTVGHEAKLAFTVLAPWFRTGYAYLAYAFAALGTILGAAWLSSHLSRRKNALLEKLVAQRTGELHASNTRLASQVEEIQMLLQAIEQSPVGVLITQPDGTIIFTNPQICALTNYLPTELIGKNSRHLTPVDIAPNTLREIATSIQRGESWHGQLALCRKTGDTIQVRSSIAPVRSPNKQIRLHLILMEDITAWLSAQDRHRRLEAQLAQSQKLESLGTLAGGIAHDFNNILTGILGYCELAQLTDPIEPELQDQLRQIRTAGLRAKDLVTQILTFSRRNITKLVPLDLAASVTEALKLIRASTPATIEITSVLESGTILADSTQIQQVVLNLCTNAVHAMRGYPGLLNIAVQQITVDQRLSAEIPDLSSGTALRLSITDNGHGMDETTVSKIFDPFFTTKRQGEGTGLGLSIVQGVMLSHHGAIRVRSTLGVGTHFELYFPLSAEAVRPPVTNNSAPHGTMQEIILVDDEPAVAEFATRRLRQLGYHVTVFHDPLEALAGIRATPMHFHAIITDLTMPHLTGVQLIEEARRVNPAIPAIIITGYGQAGVGTGLETLERCRMLAKPFSGEDLARLLHEILHR